MSKPSADASRKERNKTIRWVITIFLVTILVSGIITYVSDILMDSSSIYIAYIVLLVIVLIGILFDIIGVAVTSADEKPFHSMAARKVPGSIEAIRLLRNAERVSSICNDVIGDICGVVSGAAAATITAQVIGNFDASWGNVIHLAMSAFVAGATVGGKAIGKSFAINSCTVIVSGVGKFIYTFNRILPFSKKDK